MQIYLHCFNKMCGFLRKFYINLHKIAAKRRRKRIKSLINGRNRMTSGTIDDVRFCGEGTFCGKRFRAQGTFKWERFAGQHVF